MTKTSEVALGRPRCETAKKATLDAVWRLHERMPLASMTIEAIAKEAGVGKATIYRWWPNKGAVALDAFLLRYLPLADVPSEGTSIQKLERFVSLVAKAYTGEVARLAADLIAEGQSDPALLQMFKDKFVRPRRRHARPIIEAGIAAGEIRADVDPELALDVLFSPVYFRMLVQNAPLDEAFIEQLPKLAIRCLLPDPDATSKRS